jgi:hypothetical protein
MDVGTSLSITADSETLATTALSIPGGGLGGLFISTRSIRASSSGLSKSP